jgi:hypothetical protein
MLRRINSWSPYWRQCQVNDETILTDWLISSLLYYLLVLVIGKDVASNPTLRGIQCASRCVFFFVSTYRFIVVMSFLLYYFHSLSQFELCLYFCTIPAMQYDFH